ncbi:MAG TPA: serine/threonine-protein kinase, partial [Polyangiaceae bacterium]|nr:serine/threonine-protein kinase [Polyangiaceae bacterium]
MAEVYLAESAGPHGFAKRVAVKRILPQLSRDPRFVAMFCDEAKICAMLEHPNIVKVIDFGEANGELFMAMEYVDGISVARLLRAVSARGERFPLGAVLYIAHEILRALAHAHEAIDDYGRPLNIVHRDVSPGNVLIGREGEVKLTDFGIVRSAFVDRRTHPGELKGKLGYMSPEQVMGEELDPRSDLFTAAIIIAELCLVRPLFPGQNELEILTRTHRADLEVLDRFGANLPATLQAALRRALSATAKDRFQSAREFLSAVRGVARAESLALNADQLAPWMFTIGVLGPRSGSRDTHMAAHESGARAMTATPTAPGTSGTRNKARVPALDPQETATVVGGSYWLLPTDAREPIAVGLPELVEGVVSGRFSPSLAVSRDGERFEPLHKHQVFSRFTRGPLYESGAASVDWTVSIARWELPGVLFHTAIERLNGALRVEVQGRVRQLFLVQGRPRLVVSPDPADLLGARLRAKSLIEVRGLNRVLSLACERGEPFGEVCVREGIVTRDHLEFLLKDQLEAKLAALGALPDSLVSFLPGLNAGLLGAEWQRPQLQWVTQLVMASFAPSEVVQVLTPCLPQRLLPGKSSVPPSELGLPDPMRRALLFASGGDTLSHLIHSLRAERIAQERETLFAVFLGLSAGLLSCSTFDGPFDPT